MLEARSFIQLALDLSASLTAADRYRRLLDTVRRVLPCDAASLLRLDRDGALAVVGTFGLREDVLGRRFPLTQHPRLEAICRADDVVCFPPETKLPDPFDGLLSVDPTASLHVHACLGCSLRVEGELVGALTADALDPGAFAALDLDVVRALAALAGAALRTAELVAALELRATRDGTTPRALLRARPGPTAIVGRSGPCQRLHREVDLVAPTDLPVLVTGETGVGKELVVRAIHESSRRASQPLVQLNCAALPESLVESELFGHVKGAFTGAQTDRQGKLQLASGGTLFLDEIGELPLAVQPKLLRAIQQGEVQRVGSDTTSRVDVRLLAATNRNLEEEVAAGRFRADLYHRLAVYPLRVPPLRERPDDVSPLAGHFAEQARARLGTGPVRIVDAVLERLVAHDWPGNVRELENVVSRAVLRAAARAAPGDPVVVGLADLGVDVGPRAAPDRAGAEPPASARAPVVLSDRPLREAVDDFQRELVSAALERSGGNWSEAARRLKMDRANLHHLAVRLGLKSPPSSRSA